MNEYYKRLIIILMTFVLGACGGGNNAPSSNVLPIVIDVPQYSIFQPTLLTAYPVTGVPTSQVKVIDFGMGFISFPARIASQWNNPLDLVYEFPATTVGPFIFEPTGRMALSNKAWDAGWTGKGATISLVDDFTTQSILYSINFQNISRDYNFSSTYSDLSDQATVKINTGINYTLNLPNSTSYDYLTMSHGDLVELIAGGNGHGNIVSTNAKLFYRGSKTNSCSIISDWKPGTYQKPVKCSDFDNPKQHLNALDLQQKRTGYERDVIINYKKTPGIAKDALVVRNNVLLTAGANPIKLVSDIQGHLLNSKKTDVINLSMGVEIPTNGQSLSQVMDAILKFPIPKLEAVIVVAAGNGGAPCADLDLSGCNAIAASMAFQASTGESTIIAGALQGEGLNENIADYSTRAGILADRFLLAPGDSGYTKITWYEDEWDSVGSQKSLSYVKGTSFAAPIISGAAAIVKQRYPSLSSKQIANVLLLSADKDINNDGIPDFSGVSLIYGHGKLDINRALNLAAAIK